MKIERRFVKGAEIRASEDGHISGHASVFDEEYVLWDSPGYRAVEIVKPGAFARALKEKHDVRCLFNHDPNQILGRTAAGTMSLKEDDKGLYFDTKLPETQLGRDMPVLVKRGDVTGASFAFTVTKQTVREIEIDGKTVRTREIEDVELFDASPVTYPAYTGTDVNARALEMRGQMFPGGIPAEVLELVPELRADDAAAECGCPCRACYAAECDECEMHMVNCGDEQNCDHTGAAASRSMFERDYASDKNGFKGWKLRDAAPTKRVDGEDLTSSAFIYVGDPKDPATWSLPWKFKSEAKIKSHLRNALARFNQTQKIPADAKAAAWKKLVRLAKKHGIKVTDEESKSWNLTAEQRDTIGGGKNCECNCPECLVGDCENCSEPNCDDAECDHDGDEDDRSAVLLDIDSRMRQAGMKLKA